VNDGRRVRGPPTRNNEIRVRLRTPVAVATLIWSATACFGNPKPKPFGDDLSLLPSVEVRRVEGQDPHLIVQLPKAAYVNAFLVTPGEETVILYPETATSARLEPGSHQLRAYFGDRSEAPDTGRVLRRPTGALGGRGGGGQTGQGGMQGRGGMDESLYGATRRWVLVYASQDSVPLDALRRGVMGHTVPGYVDEALLTVAKTVHGLSPRGKWAAIATQFYR
jgi:hypothetical protein